MKKLHVIQWVIIAIMGLGYIVACSDSDGSTSTASTEATKQTLTAQTTQKSTIIDKACYDAMTTNYLAARTSNTFLEVVSGNSQKNNLIKSPLKGFNIPHGELREILRSIDQDSTTHTHEVYGMLGQNTTVSNGTRGACSGINQPNRTLDLPIPHLIFALKKTPKGGGTATISYYDFTYPCPNLCPS